MIEYEYFLADENIVLAKRVFKRKKKRCEGDCSDISCSVRRRKKKPATETADDVPAQNITKHKNTIPMVPDSDRLVHMKEFREFANFCKL